MTFYIGRTQSDEMQTANIDLAVRCAELRLRHLKELHREAAKIDQKVADHLKKEADKIDARLLLELYSAQALLNSFNRIKWPVTIGLLVHDIGKIDPESLETAGLFDMARSLVGDDLRKLPSVDELEKVAAVLTAVGRPKLAEALARHSSLLRANETARKLA